MCQAQRAYTRIVTLLSICAVSGPALAEDTATSALRSLFGGNITSLITGGSSADTVMGSTIAKMVGVIVGTVGTVALALLAVALLRRLILSAQSGKFLAGEQGDSVWFVARAVLAAMLLLPLPSGVATSQVMVLWLAQKGSDAASGILAISKAAKVGDAMFSPAANIPPPTTMGVQKAAVKNQVSSMVDMVLAADAQDSLAMRQMRVEKDRWDYDQKAATEAGLPAPPSPADANQRAQIALTLENDKGFTIGFRPAAPINTDPSRTMQNGAGYNFPYISNLPADRAYQRSEIVKLVKAVDAIRVQSKQQSERGELLSTDWQQRREALVDDATFNYLQALDAIILRSHARAVQKYQSAYENGDFWQDLTLTSTAPGATPSAATELPVLKAAAVPARAVPNDWIGLGGVYMASHAAVMQTKANLTTNVLNDAGNAASDVGSGIMQGIKVFLTTSPIDLVMSGIERLKNLADPKYVQREAYSSFKSLALSAQRTLAAGGNPMALMQATGQALVDTMSAAWLAMATMRAIADAFAVATQSQSVVTAVASVTPIVGAIAGGAASFINSLMDVFRPLAMGGYLAGFGLALYIPAVPFIIWLGMVVAWLVAVCEAFIGVVPWAVMHLVGDEQTLFPSRTHSGYSMLFALLIRPAVYVLSFHFAAAIFLIIAGLANGAFPHFADTIVFDSLTSIVWTIGLLILFFALMVVVTHKSFEAAPVIADRMLRWIGADSPTFNSEGRAHAMFASGIGRMYGGRSPRGSVGRPPVPPGGKKEKDGPGGGGQGGGGGGGGTGRRDGGLQAADGVAHESSGHQGGGRSGPQSQGPSGGMGGASGGNTRTTSGVAGHTKQAQAPALSSAGASTTTSGTARASDIQSAAPTDSGATYAGQYGYTSDQASAGTMGPRAGHSGAFTSVVPPGHLASRDSRISVQSAESRLSGTEPSSGIGGSSGSTPLFPRSGDTEGVQGAKRPHES